MKVYYRLVYWKRRLVGTRAPRAPGPRGAGHRSRRLRTLRERARPLLVFAVIVAIVLVLSLLLSDTRPAGPLGGL